MTDNKKYYYLKLKDNFFDSDEIVILESMQDGYLYENILLKLYARSLKTDGKLMYNNIIPYNAQLLATITRHQVGTMEKALKVFMQLGLIEILDNGAIYMLNIQDFIGQSSTEADRKRNYRNRIENDKALLVGGNGTNVPPDVPEMSQEMSGKCPDKNPPEIRDKRLEFRDKNLIPPLTPPQGSNGSERKTPKSKLKNSTFPALFLQFWEAYPKKCNKDSALKAWNNIPDPAALLPKMLEVVRGFAQSSEWKRDGGRYIPYAATWLNHSRWEDEIPKPMQYCDDNNKSVKTGGTNQFLKMALAEMEEVEDAEK